MADNFQSSDAYSTGNIGQKQFIIFHSCLFIILTDISIQMECRV